MQTLINYGFSCLGELKGNTLELNKTVKIVYELIQQRQRDIEFRNEIIEKIAKLESDKNTFSQNIIRLKTELENQRKINGQLENMNKINEKKMKIEKEKAGSEKEEIQKQIFKLTSKESQLMHEIRKKDNETIKLKEQVDFICPIFYFKTIS